MKTISVLFDNGFKEYRYMCLNPNVKPGDWALVMTPRGIPAVVTVVKVVDSKAEGATKGIIEILNKEEIVAKSEEAKARYVNWMLAKTKLEEKLAKFKERAMYEVLAKEDPEVETLMVTLGLK